MIWSAAPKVVWVGSRARTLASCLLAVLVAVSFGALAARPAHADTFTVDTTAYPGTSGGCDATDDATKCSLKVAVNKANGNAESDTINFASGLNGDILLHDTAAHVGFTIQNDTPAVDLTINGPGAGVLAVNGNNETRAFGIAEGARATIKGLTIKNGKAPANENVGAIGNDGTLTLINTTVSGNTAGLTGGGILNEGRLRLTNSTVSGNKVTSSTAGAGAGIYSQGTLTLTNSTVGGNSAATAGGGILSDNGTLTLTQATLNRNSAPTGANLADSGGTLVSMRATIFANPLGGGTNCFHQGAGTINFQGFNLEFPGSSCGAEFKANPLLAPLAFNGGPTQTYALQPGSAAIDRVSSNCPPPATDQRSVARPKDGDKNGTKICDIGAYERSDLVPPRVRSTDPTSGKTGVRRNTNLIATFSEKMMPTSISEATFKLFRCASATDAACKTQITNVRVTPSSDGLSAKLNPFGSTSTLLAANTRYKAIVTAGAKDLAGNALDQSSSTGGNQPRIWYFTTGST